MLLIDEFAPEWVPFTELLNLLDGHPLQMQVKGGFVTAKWTKVVITAQQHPSKWFAKANIPEESWKAFMRRVHKVVEFDEHRTCEHVDESKVK